MTLGKTGIEIYQCQEKPAPTQKWLVKLKARTQGQDLWSKTWGRCFLGLILMLSTATHYFNTPTPPHTATHSQTIASSILLDSSSRICMITLWAFFGFPILREFIKAPQIDSIHDVSVCLWLPRLSLPLWSEHHFLFEAYPRTMSLP